MHIITEEENATIDHECAEEDKLPNGTILEQLLNGIRRVMDFLDYHRLREDLIEHLGRARGFSRRICM